MKMTLWQMENIEIENLRSKRIEWLFHYPVLDVVRSGFFKWKYVDDILVTKKNKKYYKYYTKNKKY